MTDKLTELPKALANFQQQHTAAGRDSKGNYGTYTSLAGALAAVQPATNFGLSHTQTIHPLGEAYAVVRTTLLHVSGESVYSDLPIPLVQENARGNAMQALGSALTYARRYSLLAIYGLAGDDDDAESTGSAPRPQPKATPAAKPAAVKKTITPDEAQQPPAKAAAGVPRNIEWIDEQRRQAIASQLRTSPRKDEILAAFKAQFKIATPRISPEQIQLPEHGDFLEAQLALDDDGNS